MGTRTAAAALVVTLAAACGDGGSATGGAHERPRVVTALYPLTFLAERIGGGHVEVTGLTPPGAEPHDLELSASRVGDLSDADLVLYVGERFQPAVSDVVAALGPQRALDVLTVADTLEAEHSHEEEQHGEADPHVWLDPHLFMEISEHVSDRLATIDPGNAAEYEANARALEADLEALHADMRAGLQSCERREIVVSHEAFGYLAEQYDLEQVGIAGVDPEAEPSPARLADLKDFAEDHEVTTIFFEELVSPDIAETLAAELGVETDVLTPLESAPTDGNYLSAMRSNLESLRDALGCR